MGSNITSSYGWQSSQAPTSCGYIAPAVVRILRKHAVKRVLDVGCGNGALCEQLVGEGYEVVGIDGDDQGIQMAKEKHPRIDFVRINLDDDPRQLLGQKGPFDAVVSTEVVEHLYSPHRLPQYAVHMLKPGGLLVVSTPYHGFIKNLALSLANGWDRHFTALWHGGHIKFWSRRTLTTLLEQSGFKVTSFYGVGRLPFLWKSMILVAQRPD